MKKRTWIDLGVVLVILVAASGVYMVRLWQAERRAEGEYTACKSNLKNIGTACEMYSTDSYGWEPTFTWQLTPYFLKTIPTCPAAGTDTYSSGFHSDGYGQHPHGSPFPQCAYTVVCSGHHHALLGVPPNYPQYTSWTGPVAP